MFISLRPSLCSLLHHESMGSAGDRRTPAVAAIALAPQLAMLFLIDFVVVQVAAHHNSEDQTDLESRSARRANGIQEACRSGFHFAKAFAPWIIL